ncbi:type II toxin-antitoxin system PemK/MazF family toxin [Bacillus haimaensis]|uniref:type II toxin-antitoxin system PemK/MazF family toxin n=1 Tax=Bacillus haimaensis TaxID=3160967 RepID=UPI003AA8EE39
MIQKPINVTRGDVYWVNLGEIQKGNSVQRGERLVVIVSNNIGNKYSPVLLAAPCTTRVNKFTGKVQASYSTQVEIKFKEYSVVMCEQVMAIDRSQILSKHGTVTPEEMERIDDALKISLALMDY